MKRFAIAPHLIGLYPLGMMTIFFLGPLAFMVVVSFYLRDPLGFYKVDFVWENYGKFFSSFYYSVSLRSIWTSALASLLTVALAFPAIFIIVGMRRKWQLVWVIGLLALMCLSEVVIGFAWVILMSESAGIPRLLGWLGLWENPRSLSPSRLAMLIGMVSLGFSLVALMFYPQLSQRDRAIEEAAQTLGTPPAKVFFKVVLPIFRPALASSLVTMFVFYLGVYVMPTMLGRPQDWNMSVIITDKAVEQANMPLGAALAVIMLVFTVLLIGGFALATRKEGAK